MMNIILIAVIIGLAIAIAFLLHTVVKQDKRMDQLQRQITAKKDDIEPYLRLLGKVPAENWNDFMRNPAQVARALGLVVEEHALTQYNNQLVKQLLNAAARARSRELREAHTWGYTSLAAQEYRTTAENYERKARALDEQQRLAR